MKYEVKSEDKIKFAMKKRQSKQIIVSYLMGPVRKKT